MIFINNKKITLCMVLVCMVAQDLRAVAKNVVADSHQSGASRNSLARLIVSTIIVAPALLTGWNVWQIHHMKKQVETLNRERRAQWSNDLTNQTQQPEKSPLEFRVAELERGIEAMQFIQQSLMEKGAMQEEVLKRFATKDELALVRQQAETLNNEMKTFVKTNELHQKVAQMFEYTATKLDGNYLNLKKRI